MPKSRRTAYSKNSAAPVIATTSKLAKKMALVGFFGSLPPRHRIGRKELRHMLQFA